MEDDRKPSVGDLKNEHKDMKKLLHQKDKLFIANCVLYRKITNMTGEQRQILLSEVLKKTVLESIPNHAGYQGV